MIEQTMEKPIIYQMLPRLWGNDCESRISGGSLEENGTGRLADIDGPALEYFKWLGCTHIWYTGIIRHSTKTASAGCAPSNPQFVKGEAGSPYGLLLPYRRTYNCAYEHSKRPLYVHYHNQGSL